MIYKVHEVDDNGFGKYTKEISIEMKQVGNIHKYDVTGMDLPYPLDSVTTIIGTADGTGTYPISKWYARLAAEHAVTTIDQYALSSTNEEHIHEAKNYPLKKFKEAGERGTRIHNAIESYVTGLEWENELTSEDNRDKLEHCFRKIEKWISDGNWEIVGKEMPLFCKELKIGGSIDLLLARVNTHPENGSNIIEMMVVDFKTGSGIRWKDFLQQSAYVTCITSMLDNGIVLWNGLETLLTEVSSSIDKMAVGASIIHIEEETGKKKLPKTTVHYVPHMLLNNVATTSTTYLHATYKAYTKEIQKEKL
jgi:hypothetical protein